MHPQSRFRLLVSFLSIKTCNSIFLAETVVDKAIHLDHVGGVYGGNFKPSNFISILLKMLQLAPEKQIIVEYIKNTDFKYVIVA